MLFVFFCGALGYFSVHWMKRGGERTRQRMLQKKITSESADSEVEQVQTELHPGADSETLTSPAKKRARKGRKRQIAAAGVGIAAQGESKEPQEATEAVEASLAAGLNANLESEADAGCREEAVVDTELLASSSEQQRTGSDHVECIDSICAFQKFDNASCMGEGDACKKDETNTGRTMSDTVDVGACNSCLDAIWCPGSAAAAAGAAAATWLLDDDERCQLLGEWPETETEESCSDIDDGTWDDSSHDDDNRALLEDNRQGLVGCTTSSVNSTASSIESGRWCESPGEDGTANCRFSDEMWNGRKSSSGRKEKSVQDMWMVPFDELIRAPPVGATPHAQAVPCVHDVQQPLLPPGAGTGVGGPVCIWSAKSEVCEKAGVSAGTLQDGGKEVFTDGKQIFQPVPSATGRLLFTDGKQLYAPVYVGFSTPGTGPVLPPEFPNQMVGLESDSDIEDI